MEVEVMQIPGQDLMIGWVTDAYPRINHSLEVVGGEEYEENARVPTYLYMTVNIRGQASTRENLSRISK